MLAKAIPDINANTETESTKIIFFIFRFWLALSIIGKTYVAAWQELTVNNLQYKSLNEFRTAWCKIVA